MQTSPQMHLNTSPTCFELLFLLKSEEDENTDLGKSEVGRHKWQIYALHSNFNIFEQLCGPFPASAAAEILLPSNLKLTMYEGRVWDRENMNQKLN